jgi:hypothetical protein
LPVVVVSYTIVPAVLRITNFVEVISHVLATLLDVCLRMVHMLGACVTYGGPV